MRRILLLLILLLAVFVGPAYAQTKAATKSTQPSFSYFVSFAVHTYMNDGSAGATGRIIHTTFGSMVVYNEKKISTSEDVATLQKYIQSGYQGRPVVIIFFREMN
jgi:hypothetical protein